MSKHLKSGSPGAIEPPDDLDRNPGINQSKGTTRSGQDPVEIEGENTVEGDVKNDVTATGGIDPNQRGRANE